MAAAFRMHLRAHGTVARFFAALSDAPSEPSLALCTAAVMFILSEDQLNMDLDRWDREGLWWDWMGQRDRVGLGQ